MTSESRSQSPTVVLRISDGTQSMRQVFADFAQASRAAEAYARQGFLVDMTSATGRFLMDFEPIRRGLAL
ncbi:hypothetical protein [Paludisphaera sp.]|uniref:hypothetical protein n=1 Tax=Paludisphaera sp. TaxID=2017432 RepID=UPI00301DCC60